MQIGSDQLNAIALKRAVLSQGDRKIQRGLSSHCGQESIGTLFFDHPGDHFRSKWLDISPIRHLRIGHDRRRIGIHENDLVSLRPQRFAGLGA